MNDLSQFCSYEYPTPSFLIMQWCGSNKEQHIILLDRLNVRKMVKILQWGWTCKVSCRNEKCTLCYGCDGLSRPLDVISAWMLASNGCLCTPAGFHSVSEVVREIHLGLREYPVDDGLWDPTLRMAKSDISECTVLVNLIDVKNRLQIFLQLPSDLNWATR